jgi:L,D-peptidoglycan transpeptidase YkuD (ErfK/YbiS/YcfS/YnhG family)
MIIVNKSGVLKYKNLKFKCALGEAGIGKKRKEGDNITPKGSYKLLKLFYRSDRIPNFKTLLKKNKINKKMGWCDDSNNKNYNKLIKLPCSFSHEKLFRKDNIYDLVIPINYNTKKIVKGKGSAIFLHIAKKNYEPTRGCIALKKKDLILLLKNIKNKKINIK